VSASAGPRIRCHLCRKGFANPAATVVPVELLTRPLVAAPASRDEPATLQTPDIASPEPEVIQPSAEPDQPAIAEAPTPRFAPDPMLSRMKRPTSRRSKAARERLRARRAAKVKARDYGIAGVILFVIIALIGAGAYMILRDDPSAVTRPGDDETPADATAEPH